jgi:hypothetical protein
MCSCARPNRRKFNWYQSVHPHANVKPINGGKSRVMDVSGEPDEIVAIDLIDYR